MQPVNVDREYHREAWLGRICTGTVAPPLQHINRFTSPPSADTLKAWVYTRVPGHAFLARRSSWRIFVYIYYLTIAGNSVSSQLGSLCQGLLSFSISKVNFFAQLLKLLRARLTLLNIKIIQVAKKAYLLLLVVFEFCLSWQNLHSLCRIL